MATIADRQGSEGLGPHQPRLQRDLFGYVIGLALLTILVEPFVAEAILSPFGYFSQGVVVLMLGFLFAKISVTGKLRSTEFFFLIWFLYCILASLLFGVNRSVADIMLQAANQSKLLLFLIFAFIYMGNESARRVARGVIYIVLIGGVISFLLPGLFLDLGGDGLTRYRVLGMQSPAGFQLHPNRVGRILSLIPLLSAYQLGVSNRRYGLLLAISFVFVYLSSSRLALLFFLVILAIRILYAVRTSVQRFFIYLIIGIPISIAVAILGWDALRLSNLGSSAVTGELAPIFRIVLLIDGLTLAKEYFPLGAGLATFATPLSFDQPTYDNTMAAQTFFFRQGTALFDNNYASIIGEQGIIGATILFILFLLLFRVYFRQAQPFARICIPIILFGSLAFESVMQSSLTSAGLALILRASLVHPPSQAPLP